MAEKASLLPPLAEAAATITPSTNDERGSCLPRSTPSTAGEVYKWFQEVHIETLEHNLAECQSREVDLELQRAILLDRHKACSEVLKRVAALRSLALETPFRLSSSDGDKEAESGRNAALRELASLEPWVFQTADEYQKVETGLLEVEANLSGLRTHMQSLVSYTSHQVAKWGPQISDTSAPTPELFASVARTLQVRANQLTLETQSTSDTLAKLSEALDRTKVAGAPEVLTETLQRKENELEASLERAHDRLICCEAEIAAVTALIDSESISSMDDNEELKVPSPIPPPLATSLSSSTPLARPQHPQSILSNYEDSFLQQSISKSYSPFEPNMPPGHSPVAVSRDCSRFSRPSLPSLPDQSSLSIATLIGVPISELR